MNSLFRDLELAIAKANKSDVSRSRSERKAETKDFNPKVFELSSSDSEEKEESPDFLQVLPCNGQGTQNSLFRDLELSIAKELTDSWFVPDVKRSGSFTKVGICIRCFENSRDDHGGLKVWEDHGDSSVDKELLRKYLKRLSAEDAKRKKEEVKLDPKLFQVKDGNGFHSLTEKEQRNWITLQFIMGRYIAPYRSVVIHQPPAVISQPPAVFEESDQEDSGQEDYISDLSSMFLEDSGNMA
nr:uncharacterized protein LOC122599791 isoform X1 [Erigeron canadensis]XP_043628307.1 uncharacterized protein LOC122599791 isoform X1 [Erigeron canadensis]XP_043628308.1 uncharacterized protein LOC122599791 isoform X1 [Erigeron canadensis]XP_043628309.1 uncharacterized protein LOC122599791 isoform X1 [Erigeron canadensis]XP_043628311.1 uncharacterized protein LOC122599791 isoform X1 [Erigeron canadensis]